MHGNQFMFLHNNVILNPCILTIDYDAKSVYTVNNGYDTISVYLKERSDAYVKNITYQEERYKGL